MTLTKNLKLSRPHGLGGTDIAALLGISPYKTPLQLWAEKVGHSSFEQKDALHLRFGQHLEPFVAAEYERMTGMHTIEPEGVIFHPVHGFMFASVDRLVTASPGDVAIINHKVVADRLLECKTASPFNRDQWGEAGTDQVPSHYLLQCAWYLAVTGLELADLAVLLGNSELRVHTIRRDMRLEELILDQAQRFWHEHVLALVPPAPVNKADAHFLFPKDEPGRQYEADPETLEWLDKLAKASRDADLATDEADELRGYIMARMETAQEITHRGQVLATWRSPKPAKRIDVKALRNAHPQIAEEFTMDGVPSRRFVLKGQQ